MHYLSKILKPSKSFIKKQSKKTQIQNLEYVDAVLKRNKPRDQFN